MPDAVIALENLKKRFGRVRALDGVNLAVPAGPVGLLGPNGAGKSTLLKLLLGQLRPTRGNARIAGLNPRRRGQRLALRRVVGYMPEGDCLIPRMNAVDLVMTLGRLTGLSRRDAMTRAHEVLDYVGLEEARYRALDEYSTGMKQRLKLAQALVHDPDLLLLDEPTNGLDPQGRRHMLELIHDLGHQQGKNLLLCSHLLPDVEKTCERVVVIHKGRVLDSGVIDELTLREEQWVRVEVMGAAEAFAGELGRTGVEFERDGALRFRVRMAEESGDELFGVALRAETVLTELVPERSSLQEVFLGALSEAEAGGERGARGEGG